MQQMIHRYIGLLCMLTLFFIADSWAQGGPAPPPPPLNEVPLDGFSALLLAAGAGYGAYRSMGSKSGESGQDGTTDS